MWERRRSAKERGWSYAADLFTIVVYMMRLIQLRVLRWLGLGFASRRHRLACVIVTLFVILLILHFLTYRDRDWGVDGDYKLGRALRDPTLRADKWIVVTTIRSPTDAVRTLAKQPGWKVVVVGDKKTPKTWSWPNVIYLDLKAQMSLGYQVLPYLSYNTYARKTAGYLFAIEHGAKYIYDTDDDNFLKHDLSGFQASQQWSSHLVLVTDNLTSNPYVHFGQSTLWPRGYPLERVGSGAERRYSVCDLTPPAVQQGMVDGDPDVDAIFRLTRRHKSEPLRLTFDQAAPPYVLPQGTFAPFNSQNTFFAASAFWGLLLPGNSVSDRVVDIYRSYWAQRLLWLVGGGVSFVSPMTLQIRNPHSDLTDADAESVLYRDIGRYIAVLNRWECHHQAQFTFDCISELSRHLVAEGFWIAQDADMVDAWLSDLSSVGYVPPPLSTAGSGIEMCLSDKSKHHRMVFYPVEQNTSLPHSTGLFLPEGSTNWELVTKHVSSACGPMHGEYWTSAMRNARKYPNILLVVSVQGNIHSSLPSLEATYRPHFPNIVYCARHKISDGFVDRWKVSVVWIDEDPDVLPCVIAAGAVHYSVHGVFHVTSNIFVNSERGRITNFVDSLVWTTAEFHAYSSSTLSQCYRKSIACRHMSRDIIAHFTGVMEDSTRLSGQRKAKLRSCITKLEGDPTWVSQKDALWISDFAMYVPSRLIPQLAELRGALSPEPSPQYDLLVALMFECDQLTVNYLRHSVDIEALTDVSKADYVLPFPFDKVNSVVDATKQFCSYIEQFK